MLASSLSPEYILAVRTSTFTQLPASICHQGMSRSGRLHTTMPPLMTLDDRHTVREVLSVLAVSLSPEYILAVWTSTFTQLPASICYQGMPMSGRLHTTIPPLMTATMSERICLCLLHL